MQWRNTSSRYGIFRLFLHWGSALVVFGLFGLGLWMRELSYYDPWYHPAPALHKSIGILLAIALLVRIVWRFVSPPPPAPANHGPLTRVASKLGHLALYGLLLAVIVAGYLISTADGEPISVFGWFSVPATLSGLPDQADVAGEDVYKRQVPGAAEVGCAGSAGRSLPTGNGRGWMRASRHSKNCPRESRQTRWSGVVKTAGGFSMERRACGTSKSNRGSSLPWAKPG